MFVTKHASKQHVPYPRTHNQCVPSIQADMLPSISSTWGFPIKEWHSTSKSDARGCLHMPCFMEFHIYKLACIKGERWAMCKGTLKKILQILVAQVWPSQVPNNGVTVCKTDLKRSFRVSLLGNKPRTMNLVSKAQHRISRSINAKAPLCNGLCNCSLKCR